MPATYPHVEDEGSAEAMRREAEGRSTYLPRWDGVLLQRSAIQWAAKGPLQGLCDQVPEVTGRLRQLLGETKATPKASMNLRVAWITFHSPAQPWPWTTLQGSGSRGPVQTRSPGPQTGGCTCGPSPAPSPAAPLPTTAWPTRLSLRAALHRLAHLQSNSQPSTTATSLWLLESPRCHQHRGHGPAPRLLPPQQEPLSPYCIVRF